MHSLRPEGGFTSSANMSRCLHEPQHPHMPACVPQPQAVVLADGRCALCRASDTGLAASQPISLSRFVCRAGSGAVSARIGEEDCRQSVHGTRQLLQHAFGIRLESRERSSGWQKTTTRVENISAAGATAQLIAVGLASGDVALYRYLCMFKIAY